MRRDQYGMGGGAFGNYRPQRGGYGLTGGIKPPRGAGSVLGGVQYQPKPPSGPNNTGLVLGGPDREQRKKIFSDYGFAWDGNNEMITQMRRYGMGMHPGMSQGVGMFNEIASQRNGALRNALRNLDPANAQGMIEKKRRSEAENAAEMAKQLAATMPGVGSGAIAGMQRDMMNQALVNTNDYASQLNSPEGQAQMYQGLLALMEHGMQIPGLDQLLAMNGMVEPHSQFAQSRVGSGSFFNHPIVQNLAGLVGKKLLRV